MNDESSGRTRSQIKMFQGNLFYFDLIGSLTENWFITPHLLLWWTMGNDGRLEKESVIDQRAFGISVESESSEEEELSYQVQILLPSSVITCWLADSKA